ncbi:hypothetical protein D6855_14335 [Butyrivibrio sp. CB08]|uniref:hypothetical protein n=1 Tax=Butyrivibrio sp. CB08 TaxID=2364879 RepID=UPI000EA9F991|nr:hypothetical protein [Butyrivibrio sp. CB08]RKM56843.1 hypothetical protein D6855_14335 [Butyrivibrio sp. CB08]
MKRTVALCIFVMSLLVSACGKDYNKNDFSSVIKTISWNMTMEDIVLLEGTPDDTHESLGSTFAEYEGKLDGYKGTYIYRFDENGTLDFIKFRFEEGYDANSYINAFIEEYGEPDKKNDYSDDWYGLVQGEKALFAYTKDTMVEVDKVD